MPTAKVPEPVIVTGAPAEPGSVITTGTEVLSAVLDPDVGSTVELVTVIGATVGMANDTVKLQSCTGPYNKRDADSALVIFIPGYLRILH